MPLVYQETDQDYVDGLNPDGVVARVAALIDRRQDGGYGHVYYGDTSTASPVLGFAYSSAAGVFVSVNPSPNAPGGPVYVYQASDDFGRTFRLQWGQDHVAIPFALCLPVPAALRVIEHFCRTGGLTADPNWRDYDREVGFDLYDVDGA